MVAKHIWVCYRSKSRSLCRFRCEIILFISELTYCRFIMLLYEDASFSHWNYLRTTSGPKSSFYGLRSLRLETCRVIHHRSFKSTFIAFFTQKKWNDFNEQLWGMTQICHWAQWHPEMFNLRKKTRNKKKWFRINVFIRHLHFYKVV